MLMEVAEMPHRPSDLLSMPADGYSPVACLDFDLGCVGFARRFRRMQEATVLVDAPKTGKHRRAQVSAPKHSESELLRVLGIDLEELADLVGVVSEQDWAAVDWGEDEDSATAPEPPAE